MSRVFLLAALALFLHLLAACEGGTRQRRANHGSHYVSDPDHLFFMNTRSREYIQSSPEEGVDVFRHDDLPGPPDLVIRNNWLTDRADLLLDGRVLEPEDVRRLSDRLGGPRDSLPLRTDVERKAAAEVLADYLRLVGG